MELNDKYAHIRPSSFLTMQIQTDMAESREKYIVTVCQQLHINPDILIDQQKEINELRSFIEEHIKAPGTVFGLIKAMSLDELAEWLYKATPCTFCVQRRRTCRECIGVEGVKKYLRREEAN